MPIATEQSHPGTEDSNQVHKRVRLMAVLGTLLTSCVIGGIATLMLYTSQVETLRKQLFFSIELEATALEAELSRLGNIASQVTSRTRIRQELERYNGGKIGIQALTNFTAPKLADAMHSNSDVLGITRLSRDLTPLLSVGSEIPSTHWPLNVSEPEIRFGIPQEGKVVVSAPIRNRAQEAVGVDLVMFSDDRLKSIMQEFFGRVEGSGSVQIVTLVNGRAHHFYDIGHTAQPLSHETLKSELIAQLRLGLNAGLHSPDGDESGKMIVTHGPIGSSGWVFVFHTEPAQFFSQAWKQAAYAGLTVLVLALLGIVMTSRIIEPLVSRISSETRNLQRLLRRNEQLLETVQANEAKLQAVIDNAPAVIYIKDREGKYLLVNSSYERLVSRPREQIIGSFDYEIFPEDIAKSTRDTDLEVLNKGKSLELDETAMQADGMHHFISTKFPLVDHKGEIYGICGIASNITERKQVERRLALTQTTVDRANVGIYWADAQGQLLYVNDTALEMLELNRRALPHTHLSDLTTAFDQADWSTHWQSIKDSGNLHYEMDYQRSDGSDYPVEVYASHLVFGDQEFYIALIHDISARRDSERRLRQSATVFDCAAEAIVITDTQGIILDVNAAFTEILGYPREEVIGRNPRIWKSDFHDDAFYEVLWRSIRETGEWRGEIINRNKDGSITPALSTISTVRNESGEPISHVAIYTDVSQMKKSQQQLAHLAHHDPLTNLPNRVLFYERLEHCLERAARHEGHVAVIFLDLDHFKHVNDSLGHSFGDKLLIQVAAALTAAVRGEDTVARIGGDEFTILIEDMRDKTSLSSVVEKVLCAFDHEFQLGESSIRVTPSLGVSLSPDDGQDAETLMHNADAAMYRAKAAGRNTYKFYTG